MDNPQRITSSRYRVIHMNNASINSLCISFVMPTRHIFVHSLLSSRCTAAVALLMAGLIVLVAICNAVWYCRTRQSVRKYAPITTSLTARIEVINKQEYRQYMTLYKI